MTEPECEHDYEVASIDADAGSAAARMVTFQCTKCDTEHKMLTAKTDAEIAQALAEAKAGE